MKHFRRLALALLLLAPIFASAATDTNNMVLRSYTVMPSIFECEKAIILRDRDLPATNQLASTESGTPANRRNAPELEDFFRDAGVAFPAGSYVYYNSSLGQLFLHNTVANHARFGTVLTMIGGLPSQIEIDASFVAFPLKDIETAARKQARAAPTTQQVMELWMAGKGRLVGTQKVVTRSGVNAQMQGVDEVIYPTEFESTQPQYTTKEPPALSPVVPGSFETREAGMIFNVTPTVGPDGRTIDLVMAPELCELAEWDKVTSAVTTKEGASDSLTLLQPRFHTVRTTTTVVLNTGETVVTGGTGNRKGDEYIYLFVTPTILTADAKPMLTGTNAPLLGIELPADEAPRKGGQP